MLVDGETWSSLGGRHGLPSCTRRTSDLLAGPASWERTWFAAEAEFVHVGGASSDRRWSAEERSRRVARAEGAMIRRHETPAGAAVALAFMRMASRPGSATSPSSARRRRRRPAGGSLVGLKILPGTRRAPGSQFRGSLPLAQRTAGHLGRGGEVGRSASQAGRAVLSGRTRLYASPRRVVSRYKMKSPAGRSTAESPFSFTRASCMYSAC